MRSYANTNTNQALRDLRGMLVDMPVQRSQNEYRSALGKGAELQAMAGMKEHEMRLPALQVQQAKAEDELNQMNAPFRIQNLAKGVADPSPDGPYDARITPDQAHMLVQDQKSSPPALKQFEENVKQMGFQIAPDGSFIGKDGSPVSYRQAAPIHREWLRTMNLNTDYEKARDMQVLALESKGNLTPEEQAKLQKLKAVTPLQLAEKRYNDLLQIQMQDPMWNRPEGKLLQPMIQAAADRVNELKGGMAEQSRRDFELEKIDRRGAAQIEAARIRSAGRGGGGKAPSAAQVALETETALRHGVGTAQSEGIPVEWDDKAKRPIGQLNKQQFDRFNQIMKQVGHMTYAVPGEVTTGGDDWIPFNEKQEQVYDLTDLVPASVPFQSGGIDQGGEAPQGAPQGLPQGAKQAPDGNYYVEQGGKFFRVDPVDGEAKAGQVNPQNETGRYEVRQPYQGESDYFAKNPNVSGMAAEDGRIILNPNSNLSAQERDAVIKNESVRLFMRERKITPDFQLTPEQKQFFANTPYGKDEAAAKQTIVARILSGDPSAGNATPEQMAFAEKVGTEMGYGSKPDTEKQVIAQKLKGANVPMEVDMMKGPTPEQRAAANQEMNALLSKLGIGKSNWQAAGRLVRDMGGWAWEEYSRLYNLLASPIAEAYSKEGRQEGIDRLRGKRD